MINLHRLAYKSMGFGRCARPRHKSCFSSLFESHPPDYVTNFLKCSFYCNMGKFGDRLISPFAGLEVLPQENHGLNSLVQLIIEIVSLVLIWDHKGS